MPVLSNKNGAVLEIYRFSDKTVGLIANKRFIGGDDCFDENDFLEALWLLYPNGLPKPEKPLSAEEKQIRALTVFFMNEKQKFDGNEFPWDVEDYEEMMSYWDMTGPEAREKAEAVLALVKGD